ncbi:MAG TPA: YdcF family protein [Candidatus Paceibacterota bacterium]|nr:YdcF family protein [Candidatus Paceibacterota bacterium]
MMNPHLPQDGAYLHALAEKIPAKTAFADIRFEYLTELFTSVGIAEDPYSYVNLDGNNAEAIDCILTQSFEAVQIACTNPAVQEQLHRLWDYLAEEDELAKVDLIFVFGGIELTRMIEGVRLLKLGYAEKLLFSGKHASYVHEADLSEAEFYAQEAEKLGVGRDQLILETEAVNTPENVINSVALLHRMQWMPEKVIIVTSPYHLRRAYLTSQAVADWHPQLIRRGAPSTNHARDLYFKDQRTWSLTVLEYLKIYGGRVMKHF